MAATIERVCDGSRTSSHCATRVRHEHCECGLPKRVGSLTCTLCLEDRTLSLRRFEREVRDGLMAARAYHGAGRTRKGLGPNSARAAE